MTLDVYRGRKTTTTTTNPYRLTNDEMNLTDLIANLKDVSFNHHSKDSQWLLTFPVRVYSSQGWHKGGKYSYFPGCWESLVIPGNYWELSCSLIKKKTLIYLLTAIQPYLQCKNAKNKHYNSTFYQIVKKICITFVQICKYSCSHIVFLVWIVWRRACMFTCLSLSISCYDTLTFKVSAITLIVTCLLNVDNWISSHTFSRQKCLIIPQLGGIHIINQCDILLRSLWSNHRFLMSVF